MLSIDFLNTRTKSHYKKFSFLKLNQNHCRLKLIGYKFFLFYSYLSFSYFQRGSCCQFGFISKALGSTFGYLVNNLPNLKVNSLFGWIVFNIYFIKHIWIYSLLNSCCFGTCSTQLFGGFDSSLTVPGKFLFHSRVWCAQKLRICAMDCNQLGKYVWFTAPNSLAIASLELVECFKLPYSFERPPKLVCSKDFQAGGKRLSSLCFCKWFFIAIN